MEQVLEGKSRSMGGGIVRRKTGRADRVFYQIFGGNGISGIIQAGKKSECLALVFAVPDRNDESENAVSQHGWILRVQGAYGEPSLSRQVAVRVPRQTFLVVCVSATGGRDAACQVVYSC